MFIFCGSFVGSIYIAIWIKILWFFSVITMSNMKPQKRKCGNKNPLPRKPCPDVDDSQLQEQFEKHVRKSGVKDAFNLHTYHNLDTPNGTCSRSMAKLLDLIWVLAKISPTGEIKWKNLKSGVKHCVDLFGAELLKEVKTETHLKAGNVADALITLLYHLRRTMRTDDEFDKVMSALDDTTALDFKKLRSFMDITTVTSPMAASSSMSSRTLEAKETDVTVDSDGYPDPFCSISDDETIALGSPHRKGSLAKEALLCSPPPVAKAAWREKALKKPASHIETVALKKPASSIETVAEKKPAASKEAVTPPKAAVAAATKTPGKLVAKKLKVKAVKSMKKAPLDFKINSSSLSTGGGHEQTYIQHIPKDATSKQLIIAVNSNMVDGLKCSHKEAIKLLMPSCMKTGAKKSDVLKARAKLLNDLM